MKVLVVSDIKKELGYSQRVGHREWRKVKQYCYFILYFFVIYLIVILIVCILPCASFFQISSRLKDAKLVQEFDAVVNEKVA